MKDIWRYQNLRDAVAALAAPAVEQSNILNAMFEEMDGENARYRPNDELYETFFDIYVAHGTMAENRELSDQQLTTVTNIYDYFANRQFKPDFWERPALFVDPQWDEIRAIAGRALNALPPLS